MDALTSLGIDLKLLIAQIVNFGILLFVLSKFLYKPLVKILDERKDKIAQGLKDSKEAQVKLDEAEAVSRKKISEAVTQANSIIEKAKKEAELEANQILDKAKDKASVIIVKAKDSAKQQEEDIVRSVRLRIATLVGAAFEKITQGKADQQSIDRAIEELK